MSQTCFSIHNVMQKQVYILLVTLTYLFVITHTGKILSIFFFFFPKKIKPTILKKISFSAKSLLLNFRRRTETIISRKDKYIIRTAIGDLRSLQLLNVYNKFLSIVFSNIIINIGTFKIKSYKRVILSTKINSDLTQYAANGYVGFNIRHFT